ncbi:MAG: cation:proton antiporter, partial [Pseudomonadota bacterium]
VSGVFVILAASLDTASLATLDWRAAAFVLGIMLIARPIAVMASLVGTGLPLAERAMIAWVAPRGVVAVAVAGFFGTRLAELGVEGAEKLAPLAFALVAVTVVVHGFSLAPVARLLGLTSTEPPGVLILGANRFAMGLARALRDAGVPVMMVERDWHRLGPARAEGIPTYYGELLSEAAEHAVDLSRYGTLVAASENDDYNALVCTDLGPELGRDRVYQLGRHESREDTSALPVTLGGRTLLASGAGLDILHLRIGRGWGFQARQLSAEFTQEDYLAARHEKAETFALIRAKDTLFAYRAATLAGRAGDILISFTPKAEETGETAAEEAEATARPA